MLRIADVESDSAAEPLVDVPEWIPDTLRSLRSLTRPGMTKGLKLAANFRRERLAETQNSTPSFPTS